jgi:hypothetical protein
LHENVTQTNYTVAIALLYSSLISKVTHNGIVKYKILYIEYLTGKSQGNREFWMLENIKN